MPRTSHCWLGSENDMTARLSLCLMALLFWPLATIGEPAFRPEGKVVVTTNFYTVTGSNFVELRLAITQARPWKTSRNFDAYTDWTVEWRYRHSLRDGQVRVDTLDALVKASVTLPRWTPPADVSSDLVKRWKRYFSALSLHEEGHIKLARTAAAETRAEVMKLGSFDSRKELTDSVSRTANRVLDKYRRIDGDYDRQTMHGVTQGAVLR